VSEKIDKNGKSTKYSAGNARNRMGYFTGSCTIAEYHDTIFAFAKLLPMNTIQVYEM